MKAVTLYRPAVLENAFHDLDRYMESFFGESLPAPAARMFVRLPAVDIQENSNAYILEAELPGYDEKSIQIHVDGGTLTIESKKEEYPSKEISEKPETEKKESAYVMRERRRASFSRSFKLPENADPEQIAAGFKNGLLSLEIKKRPEAQKRMIQIEKR
ncbi:MAG: Hsp20 family protein [Treponema sp.]|jgi:HSP20 family protein|nr:Hsp20 family protein [Treponema sp.]